MASPVPEVQRPGIILPVLFQSQSNEHFITSSFTSLSQLPSPLYWLFLKVYKCKNMHLLSIPILITLFKASTMLLF